MKSCVLSVFALLTIVVTGFAQTEQGNFLVGGNLQLNTSKNNRVISIAPSGGMFVIDNLAIGANVGFTHTKKGDIKSTTVDAGPFGRYYFGTSNVRPFGHADVGYTSEKTKTVNSKSETGVNYFIGGGLAAFINRNVAIEGLAGYSHTALKDNIGSGGFNLLIGFQVYLSKRQVENLTK